MLISLRMLYFCSNRTALTTKITDNTYSDALSVVTRCMRPDIVPASTLVNVSILADNEVVTDIEPLSIVHMKVLVTPYDRRARFLIVTAFICASVMNDHVRCRRHFQRHSVNRWPGLPLQPAHDVWHRYAINVLFSICISVPKLARNIGDTARREIIGKTTRRFLEK